MITARPVEALRKPAIRQVVDAVLPPPVVEAYAVRTGVNPYQIEEAVLARYGDGFVLLVRGPLDAPFAVREAGARMLGVDVQVDAPFVRRGGWIGDTRQELVALAQDVLLVARNVSQPLADLLAGVQRRRTSSRGPARSGGAEDVPQPALAGTDVARLAQEHRHEHLVLYAPSPPRLPPGLGTSVLLAGERALAVAVGVVGRDELSVEVDLRGSFPENAGQSFRALVESVAESDLGGALGLREGARTLSIRSDVQGVDLRMTIPASTLAAGLRALFFADLREMLGPSPPAATASPIRP